MKKPSIRLSNLPVADPIPLAQCSLLDEWQDNSEYGSVVNTLQLEEFRWLVIYLADGRVVYAGHVPVDILV